MTIGSCGKCTLPGLVADLESYRIGAEMARANVEGSQTPTQAEPYRKAERENLLNLQKTQEAYAEFLNTWRGTCGKCEFGA